MGRSLKLRVIAEGVETRSQLSFLRVMQCDEVQGYLFSPPVPVDRARALLEAQQGRGAA
jgi:EAL domain-containing protein (putative c-di-GMP-specific phosphodiesterase class I)